MKQNTDSLYVVILGGGISSIAYLLGGLDKLVIALAVLMGIDYLSGIAVAYFYKKDLQSKKAFKGLMKKAGMISAVIVANQLDQVAGSGGSFMRNAMIMFLIGTEGISFVENLGYIGVKVPVQFSSVLEQFKDREGKGK
ncbi:phage holin family protein [Niallia sp. 01092]|uniref:phage holin family protein n=1 Tax=unclassified Niallia TaxID=2837522 RepID=UPI003FCF8116